MKKFFAVLLIALATLTANAQSYEPNTKWPYIYENFTDGTIFFEGNKKKECMLNIHLWGNKLHYLNEDQRIFQSEDKGVIRVEIGSDAYIFSDHKLVRIIAADKNNVLVELTSGDFDALFSGTGAYGSSLNSSASRDLSSLDLGGMDSPELGRMLQERSDGREISLKRKFFFIINGKQIEASKKDVEGLLSDEGKKEWNTFLKQNKIKWKNIDSLKQVLSFINLYQ